MTVADELSIFSVHELRELLQNARNALKVLEMAVAELKPFDIPTPKLLQINDLKTKIQKYEIEIIRKTAQLAPATPEKEDESEFPPPSVSIDPDTSPHARSRKIDVESLAQLLITKWMDQGDSADAFFADLIDRVDLPSGLRTQARGLVHGTPVASARRLIRWALHAGTANDDPKRTILGRMLYNILGELGTKQQRTVAASIVMNHLFLDPSERADIAQKYGVPLSAEDISDRTEGVQPLGFVAGVDSASELPIELQSWLAEPEPFYDIAFLSKAVECAASVCRLEVPGGSRTGTGFLVGPKSILTNYHVLKSSDGEDIYENALSLRVKFGYVSEGAGYELEVDRERPILSFSTTNEFDFILLQLNRAPDRVEPLTLSSSLPSIHDALQILQHPFGGPMKVALSSNAILKVARENGKMQYVTRTAGGGSGAPCFDEQWRVVGVHRAERSKAFGAVREGILLESILPRLNASII